jgi:phosphopantothenoylcysteine decarboxylase/phosphopantothenate--cysteine ligase
MERSFLKGKRILITCGPTWIPIDDVRVISNTSSGRLGRRMALDCARAGAQVTLLEGPVSNPLKSKTIRILKFFFFEDFRRLFEKEIKGKYHAVIHAAAVSDYRLKRPFKGKLGSRLQTLKLDLIPTAKLIQFIKRINPSVCLVGFKLEAKVSRLAVLKQARALFREAQCDLVVVNSATGQDYRGYILNPGGVLTGARSREEISKHLLEALRIRL